MSKRNLDSASTPRELRSLVRKRAAELGRTPRERELPARARAALADSFGSYDRAVRRMGLPPPPPAFRRWTRDAVLAELRKLHSRGVRLTVDGFQRVDRSDLVMAIYRFCGSFPRARRLAGLPVPPRGPYRERRKPMRRADLRRMRARYAKGGVTQADLAIEYDLDLHTAGLLLRGQLQPEAGGPLTRKRARTTRAAQAARAAQASNEPAHSHRRGAAGLPSFRERARRSA